MYIHTYTITHAYIYIHTHIKTQTWSANHHLLYLLVILIVFSLRQKYKLRNIFKLAESTDRKYMFFFHHWKIVLYRTAYAYHRFAHIGEQQHNRNCNKNIKKIVLLLQGYIEVWYSLGIHQNFVMIQYAITYYIEWNKRQLAIILFSSRSIITIVTAINLQNRHQHKLSISAHRHYLYQHS